MKREWVTVLREWHSHWPVRGGIFSLIHLLFVAGLMSYLRYGNYPFWAKLWLNVVLVVLEIPLMSVFAFFSSHPRYYFVMLLLVVVNSLIYGYGFSWLAGPTKRPLSVADKRARAGLCVRCGYDLRGSWESGRCPECGEDIL